MVPAYDETDQSALIRDCLALRYRIGSARNLGLDPEAFSRQKETLQDDLVAKVLRPCSPNTRTGLEAPPNGCVI